MSQYEFKSPTQKPIYKVSSEALEVRKTGISQVRNSIQECLGTDKAKELLSAMNFSVSEVTKELKRRAVKEKK